MISPLAYVDPNAKLGKNVEVKPFAYIEGGVTIGDNCVIMSNAAILEGTTMGSGNIIYQNAVIGSIPQSFHYKAGQKTKLIIGDNNRIRENTVIAKSNHEDQATIIGSNNFLMNKVHICHDVHIHDHCVLGISVSVAGESEIQDGSILSSAAIVQRHVRVGRYSLIQSGCRVQKDVPPYVILGGNPATYHGINSMVMKHIGAEDRILRHVANAYRLVYAGDFSLQDAVIRIHEQIPLSDEISHITEFITSSKYGIVRHMKEED